MITQETEQETPDQSLRDKLLMTLIAKRSEAVGGRNASGI